MGSGQAKRHPIWAPDFWRGIEWRSRRNGDAHCAVGGTNCKNETGGLRFVNPSYGASGLAIVQFIDETESDIQSLIERDFGRLPAGSDLKRAMLDWLHYKARSIPRRIRTVIISDEANGKLAQYPAISQIAAELRAGGDLTPWLSERIRRQKRKHRADLMFNSWQISHFHLRQIWSRRNTVWRSDDLLFAFIKADRAVLLDVLSHTPEPWTATDLLRILLRTSADDLPEIKGVLGAPNGGPTDQELKNLLLNGYNGPIQIDNKVYAAPGLGIASSQHATRLVQLQSFIFRTLQEVRVSLTNNQIDPWWRQKLAGTIGIPIRLGVRHQSGNLAIYEKSRSLDMQTFAALQ